MSLLCNPEKFKYELIYLRYNMFSKKSSMSDPIFGVAKLLAVAITIFIGIYVWLAFSNTMPTLINQAGFTPAQNSSIYEAMNNIQIGLMSFDYMFPFLVIGLLIVSLIFAFKTGASVIYAVLSIIMWAFALIISAIFTNIFGQFELSFPTLATSLPIITYLMNNMKWIVLVWLFLITVIMFSRNRAEEQQMASSDQVFG